MRASTFGLFRHRAWVVRQTPLESSLGSRGTPLGGLGAAVLTPLEGRFGASGGLSGASWGPLGASLEPLGGLLGSLGALLGPRGPPSGGKARFLDFWSPSWAALGAILGPSWVVLGASWAVLGPSWAILGPSWGDLGAILAISRG